MDLYKEKYEAALAKFREFKKQYYIRDTDVGDVIFDKTGKMQESFNAIFPELAESEDERIRKGLIEALKTSKTVGALKFILPESTREEAIAYLEKQKEQWIPTDGQRYALGMVIKHSNPEDESTKVLESLLDDLTKITNPKVAKWKEQRNEKQEEQKYYWKPTETDVALFNKAVTTNKTLTPAERAQLDIIRSKFGCCRAVNCNGIVQKEQNPVEWSDSFEEAVTDLIERAKQGKCDSLSPIEEGNKLLAIAKHGKVNQQEGSEDTMDEFTRNIRNLITDKLTVHTKGLDGSELSSTVFIDDKTAKDIASGVLFYVGKAATKNPNIEIPEWSEEDEHRITDAIYFLETAKTHYADTSELDATIDYLKSLRPQPKPEWSERDKAWLSEVYDAINHSMYSEDEKQAMKKYIDSLRPSWKPSEEQMKALIDCTIGNEYDVHALVRLWAELKKL